ncbi:hypothetical protein C0992_006136, partial [Termitomyces sp. T32_za158]
MSQVRGLPLLSGQPPDMESGDACRKCNKEFNMFLNRPRKCHHCVTAAGKGFLKALQLSKLKKYLEAYNIDIGRVFEKDDLIDAILKARVRSPFPVLVCHRLILHVVELQWLSFTGKRNRSTSHTRSRFFGRSAGQSSNRPVPPAPSVPPGNTRPYDFPRPDLEPNPPPPQPRAPRPGPPPPPRQTHPSHQTPPSVPPRPQYHPPSPPHHHQQQYHQQPHDQYHQYSHNPPPRPTPPQASRPTEYPQNQRPSAAWSTENLHRSSSRQRTTSAAPPATSPPPTLDQLLDMPDGSIKTLSIGALKSILFTNRVNVGQILEKGDLIVKVKALIEDERRDRERQRALHEAEEQEEIERQRAMMEEHARAQAEREKREKARQQAQRQEGSSSAPGNAREGTTQNAGTETSPISPPKARGTAADLERTGLCVICQDEEANIAIVDCG